MEQNCHTIDRRRTIRIRRLSLLKARLDGLDRPAIKIAETRDDLEQSFSLVYREYQKMGYLTVPDPSGLYISIYNILPETSVFVLKSYLTVIASLTHIPDTRLFGLPMDAIYKDELNALRDEGRRLVELSNLATSNQPRCKNIFLYLFRAVFWYSIYTCATDFCIMVNPEHVNLYKTLFLFEDLGKEKYYPKVGAPAVAMRLKLDDVGERLKEIYSDLDFDTDLHSFFRRFFDLGMADDLTDESYLKSKKVMDTDTARYFFVEKTDLLSTATPEQLDYIKTIYPGIV